MMTRLCATPSLAKEEGIDLRIMSIGFFFSPPSILSLGHHFSMRMNKSQVIDRQRRTHAIITVNAIARHFFQYSGSWIVLPLAKSAKKKKKNFRIKLKINSHFLKNKNKKCRWSFHSIYSKGFPLNARAISDSTSTERARSFSVSVRSRISATLRIYKKKKKSRWFYARNQVEWIFRKKWKNKK